MAPSFSKILSCCLFFFNFNFYLFIFIFNFFVFCLFRATPMVYGGSQARGLIGATAASLHHSHAMQDSGQICNLHCSSRQHWILNPLSRARDQTHILMEMSQIHFCCATREVLYSTLLQSLLSISL